MCGASFGLAGLFGTPSSDRYQSICYPQSGFSLVGNQLTLSKLGRLRVKIHRPIGGKIKTCTLRKNASGEWDVTFSCEVNREASFPKEEAIGIDVGLEHFATFSNGQEIPNPRFFKQGQKTLAKAQRKLAKLEKGTKKRRKQGKVVAKIHQRIGNQRKDFCHKESRKIIDQYQYICVEDLDIKKMMERSHFTKSITDVSWNQFRQFLTYKAAEAGRKLGLVNPAYILHKIVTGADIEKRKSSLKECTVARNVGIRRQGISTQRRIFWPSDWMAWEQSLEAFAFRQGSSHLRQTL